MDSATLKGIVEAAEAARSLEDLKAVLVDLALAIVQMNRETTHRAGTQAALLGFEDRKQRRAR